MSKRNHLKERLNEKLQAITFSTLVVGIDIAKKNQWARFVDCRGIEHGKALRFENNKNGFEKILATIFELCKREDFTNVVIGMEPTGHYGKPLANYLLKQGMIVVVVNPYHTKKSKELDDNSQTKSDIKDALTEIKKAVKKTVGRKKAEQLLEAAKNSIGVDYGKKSAAFRIKQYMSELEMIETQMAEVEEEMKAALEKTGLSEYLLSIPGAGVISMASVLGEMGDPLRFENPRQISRMAGYNLVEDSSGKNKSGTCISKRGRKNLRCVLYKMALTMVAVNPEMKQLYSYLNP